MITRRNFIQAIGLASATGIVLNLNETAFGQTKRSGEFFRIPEETLSDPLMNFTSEHFLPYVNTDFEVLGENSRRPEQLRLLNVKETSPKTKQTDDGGSGDSFSLLFFNPRGKRLTENRYVFSHFALGTFTMTISAVSPEPNRYEAVINHLRG